MILPKKNLSLINLSSVKVRIESIILVLFWL